MSRTIRAEKEFEVVGEIPVYTKDKGDVPMMLKIYKVGNYHMISALPHELKFDMSTHIGVLPGNLELAKVVKATPRKTPMYPIDPVFVRMDYTLDEALHLGLCHMKKMASELVGKSVSFVTSMIGVQALTAMKMSNYPPLLVAPITTTETCRLPNEQKLCYINQWSI